jgi:hypothetical protein
MGGRATNADAAVVFSSSMAPYADGFAGPGAGGLRRRRLGQVDRLRPTTAGRCPGSTAVKAASLLAFERAVAARADASFFVTDKEVALFTRLAPECAGRVQTVGNGVDADYFSPDPARPNPYEPGEVPVVFTGAMDYWPNIDAVTWFVADVLPGCARAGRTLALRPSSAAARRRPSRRWPGEAVRVTGTVPDVRPLPAARGCGRGAAAAGARHPEQGAGGHGDGAAGGRW